MAEGSESRKALRQEHLRTPVNRKVSVVQVWSVREEVRRKEKGWEQVHSGWRTGSVSFTVESIRKL